MNAVIDMFDNQNLPKIIWYVILICSTYLLYIEMKKLAAPKPVDIHHVNKRIFLRLTATLILSNWIAFLIGLKLEGNHLVFNKWWTLIIIAICFCKGVRLFYEKIGPTYTNSFIKTLKTNFGLYLRCFQSDSNDVINGVEKKLCSLVKEYLPIYAIGNPFEVLPSTGATRIYATDKEWEESVRTMMKNSSLVIIKPSRTPGCLKELTFCNTLRAKEKTIFIITCPEDLTIIKEKLGFENSDVINQIVCDSTYLAKYKANNLEMIQITDDESNADVLDFMEEFIQYSYSDNFTSKWKWVNRITFLMNPLFYTSMHEWRLCFKILVLLTMASPMFLSLWYKQTASDIFLIFLFLAEVLAVLLFFKSDKITKKKKSYVSETHYNHENFFLLLLNLVSYIVFIIAFVINTINNPGNSISKLPQTIMQTLIKMSIFTITFVEDVIKMSTEIFPLFAKVLWEILALIGNVILLLFTINPVLGGIVCIIIVFLLVKLFRVIKT